MWTLTGLVIVSILIGAITSSLTSVTVERDVMLYGTEVNPYENNISKKKWIDKDKWYEVQQRIEWPFVWVDLEMLVY